jgi:Flp pilus assembly protein TadG
MKHNQDSVEAALVAGTSERPGRSILRAKGQAAVEFALISVVAMIVLFVAVQLALIGEDALALGQMNYQGARWAAVNTCATDAEILQYMLFSGSPTVTRSGGSCGTYVKMDITDTKAAAATRTNVAGTTCTAPTATNCGAGITPRTFGTSVTIKLTFGLDKAIFLLGSGSNFGGGGRTQSWLGLSFPTKLTSNETAMAE